MYYEEQHGNGGKSRRGVVELGRIPYNGLYRIWNAEAKTKCGLYSEERAQKVASEVTDLGGRNQNQKGAFNSDERKWQRKESNSKTTG